MILQDADYINTFFLLLRAGLYGASIPAAQLPASIDWKSIIALARKHFVLGTIIDAVQTLPEDLRPSVKTCAKMNKFALGLIQTNLILDKTVARLVSFFKQHGVDGVLLKGQGVAQSYYRVPQMRQSGDIDFYVGKTIYKKAVTACREELIEDNNAGDEVEQHFGFDMNGVWIELHRLASKIYSPIRGKRFQNWVVEQLEHSPSRRTLTLDDTDITLPSYDFDAIFIFYHAWRHYIMGGIGLRQLCDWTMIFYSHGDDIDTERLIENINRFGIVKGWKLFAYIAVNYLGLPEDKMPLYDPSYRKKSEKILDDIITGGNFGFYSKENIRTPMLGYGIWHGLGKVRNITGYFFALFPLIPIEATFLYFNRMIFGTISLTKRTMTRPRN